MIKVTIGVVVGCTGFLLIVACIIWKFISMRRRDVKNPESASKGIICSAQLLLPSEPSHYEVRTLTCLHLWVRCLCVASPTTECVGKSGSAHNRFCSIDRFDRKEKTLQCVVLNKVSLSARVTLRGFRVPLASLYSLL